MEIPHSGPKVFHHDLMMRNNFSTDDLKLLRLNNSSYYFNILFLFEIQPGIRKRIKKNDLTVFLIKGLKLKKIVELQISKHLKKLFSALTRIIL